MSNRIFVKLGLSFSIVLLIVSCSTAGSRNRSPSLPATATPTLGEKKRAQAPSASGSKQSQAIRSIDFANIAYHNFPDFTGNKKRIVTLKPGEGVPSHINYGDITGDGLEEAMAVLPIEIRGSATPHHVYLFMLENGDPKPVWDFGTGDRADGGLREVYANDGELVIELYGKDRVIGGRLYQGDEGLCCPSSFTRARCKWDGKGFQQISKEVLPNVNGDAKLIMPEYTMAK